MLPYVHLAHMAHTTTEDGGFVPTHRLEPGPSLEVSKQGIAC